MTAKKIPLPYQLLVVTLLLHLAVSHCQAAEKCTNPLAKLVSIQGYVQVQRAGQSGWKVVALDEKLCVGDLLTVGGDGRAAVVLPNETVLRIDQNSTVSFGKRQEKNFSLIEVVKGALHIFSHRPRSLKVVTPYVNGAVEGTEFLVQVGTEQAVITVFEGIVAASNTHGQVKLSSGQSAKATKSGPPIRAEVVRPRDSVEWTLYYPTILDFASAPSDNETAALIRQISGQLAVGRVQTARENLAEVLQIDPGNSDGLALLSIIETVRNNKDKALDLAQQAVERKPDSAAAGLALSYAYQALFDLSATLDTIQKTADFNPDNGLVSARLAEILLATGDSGNALAAASHAVAIDPAIALSHVILGFNHLSRIETDEAQTSFTRAIALDSVFPLARLGLGLSLIRKGELEAGRAEIEIAAALDPGSSLIRSYLGKAYFDERRNNQALRQYAIAKELDPADPTPWFYDAIRKQTINRPVEALHDLLKSIALNDNRAVYRSRLLLDSDLAARSASLGRIYTDLGFQQLARAEGWKSLHSDPANFSAHRFLADIYSSMPRHEIARVSELLQSQLLQPLNITPVQPQFAESNLSILEGAGPTTPAANEFNPLFLRNRVSLQASGVVGSNEILGDELVLSGVENKLSYSVGQFYYQTDGIRENNDQQNYIYNGFVQGMLSPKTSLMSEIRSRKKTFGDLSFSFDPTDFSSTLSQSEDTQSVRVGLRHDLKPHSTLLGTAIFAKNDGNAATGTDGFALSLDINNEGDNFMVEGQNIYRGARFNIQSGAGYLSADDTDTYTVSFPFVSVTEEESRTEHANLYSYAQLELPYNVMATLGLSGDLLDSPVKDRDKLNPKVGITWQPLPSTLVRAAAFTTVTRRLIYAQTIEPTLIAGFNQFYDDWPDSTAETYGAGIDHTFSANWYGGAQFTHRNIDVPYTAFTMFGTTEIREDDWQEDIGSAYLYWAPASWVSAGLDYYYEYYTQDEFEGDKGIRDLTTHRVTPKLQFFHPCGASARLQASFIDQKGQFGSPYTGFTQDSDQFWVVDLGISYRLPKRYGIFKLEFKNLFDEQFSFLDTDTAQPRFLPEQQVLATLTVAF